MGAKSRSRSSFARAAFFLLLSGCCSMGLGRMTPREPAAYEEHVRSLQQELPPEFTVVPAPPFVVVGDAPPSLVRADAQEVVVWAATRLKADFFPREPKEIVTIWVFDTDESYRRNANALFGDIPDTPYGYYQPCHDAIVVNGSLGNGTLVHEMVHVLMEANFPDAPTWYDEGLASLFEQPIDVDGHIRGDTNWRLAGLQASLELGWRPSFEALFGMSRGQFYDEDHRAKNYAVARYLLFYLQEGGKLIGFHHRFLWNQENDPTGLFALKETMGIVSIDAFTETWSTFVMKLEQRPKTAGAQPLRSRTMRLSGT